MSEEQVRELVLAAEREPGADERGPDREDDRQGARRRQVDALGRLRPRRAGRAARRDREDDAEHDEHADPDDEEADGVSVMVDRP